MNALSSTHSLPDDVVEQLRCSHCDGYLSCGPVKVQLSGSTVCGRCSPSINEECIEQVLFETAMARFTFPCRYKLQGCKKRVLFNHAEEHEAQCPYRTFWCPSLLCSEDVSTFDICKHFQSAHPSLILNDGMFKLDFEEDIQCNLLMIKENAVVVIQYSYNSAKRVLHVDVRHLLQNDCQAVHYQLQLISGLQSDNTVNLKKRMCERFISHSIIIENATTLILNNYLSVLDNPSFIYVKVVLKTDCKEQVSTSNRSSPDNELLKCIDNQCDQQAKAAWTIMDKYRCCICHNYIVSSVYYEYDFGKMACFYCRDRTGNNTVEKKLEISNFPCRWKKCTFLGDDQTIKLHEEECQFKAIACPLLDECPTGYFTADTLINHMDKHGTYCPNPKKIILRLFYTGSNPKTVNTNIYYTVIENKVLTFKVSIEHSVHWTLTGQTPGFSTDTYFIHTHCKYTSKTYTKSHSLNYRYKYEGRHFNLPPCFQTCRLLGAVIKIKDE